MPTFQLLSQSDADQIHRAALALLAEVGMRIVYPAAQEILSAAGANIDRANGRVRFPARLVEQAIESTPSTCTLYGRDLTQSVELQPGRVHYTTNGYAVHVYDPDSRSRSLITQESLAWMTRLADWLDQVDIYAVLGTPEDAPAETNDRYQLAIALENTSKHIWNTAYGPEAVRDAVRMAAAVRGSREALWRYPLLTLDLTVISPLALDDRQASTMIEGARQGVPMGLSPGPIAGATSPVTLAGTLVQGTAEVLGAITLCQTVRPGVPVIMTQYTRSLDMASGQVTMGGPEFSLLRAATSEMARYYHIPSRGGGMITDSKAVDAQMGAEKMMGCLIPSLAGLTIVAGVGQADFINTVRPDLMVVDNEIIRCVRRFCQGFEINCETLAAEVMSEVGPAGNYLGTEHTLRNFRRELLSTRLWDRKPWEMWEAAGSKEVSERAWEMVQNCRHTVPTLPDKARQTIWDVVREADSRIGLVSLSGV